MLEYFGQNTFEVLILLENTKVKYKNEQDGNKNDDEKQTSAEEEVAQANDFETGSITVSKDGHFIHCLTIIGQIEGHYILPSQNKTTKYAALSTYKKLLYSHLFQDVSTVDVDQDKFFNYRLGATDGNVVEILNPSEALEGEQPENILPNHSGILLNNNSVIDGGEWL